MSFGDTVIFAVVVNREEQYSIFPAHRDPPEGWKAIGITGTEQECLDYIDSVWTPFVPRHLRDAAREIREQQARDQAAFLDAMQSRE